MSLTPLRRRPLARALAAAALTALAAVAGACSGDNLFRTDPSRQQQQTKDSQAPTVTLELPSDGSSVMVGDSLFTRVRVSDNRALRWVELTGFALRGDASLGTQTRVTRFASRKVQLDTLGRAVTDTTVARFLKAVGDSVSDLRVYVVATAQDTSGNVAADTAFVSVLAGPSVQILGPRADTAFQAGTAMRVRVSAVDSVGRVGSVRVRASGAFAADTTLTFGTAVLRVDTTIVLDVPVTAEGPVVLDATATSAVSPAQGGARITGVAAPVRVRAASPPTVRIDTPDRTRATTVAVGDSIFVQVRVADNRALRSVTLSGFSLRGDASLGSQRQVVRFAPKAVRLDNLGRAVTDTTITRYLLPTGDSLPESPVYLVATAQDTAGHVGADTVAISIGGPRVQITAPRSDSTFRAGTPFTVRVTAEDRQDRISSLTLRTSGAFASEQSITLRTPAVTVDTTFVVTIPAGARGELQIDVAATSTQRIGGTARPVRVTVQPAVVDAVPPRVSFTASIPARMEISDSLSVTVSGTDETRLDTLGVTLLAIRRTAAADDTLGVLTARAAVAPPTSSRTFRLGLDPLRLTGADTVGITFEVVGFAKDAAGNCATATAPGTLQSLPCRTARGATVSDQPGALSNVLAVRGRTVGVPGAGDRLADLTSDRVRVFASNFSRDRVEVLPVGSLRFGTPILVGSQPWGLAIGRDTSTLLVANSGGAGSISRVGISPASVPTRDDETRRIVTENVELYVVRFSVDANSGRINLNITAQDFSDRPQFLAETASGQVIYSTVPTPAAPDGTVQHYNPTGAEPVTDLFVEYARGTPNNLFVVRRADNVTKFIRGTGNTASDQLVVCDHRPGQPKNSICFPRSAGTSMTFQEIQDSLRASGSDAVLDANVDPALIALTDTTFLAASKDLRTVVVGEGAREIGRILSFGEDGAGNLTMTGNTVDLVSNASDRVKGLALNRDGSVGAARGNTVYLFRRDLRKLGESRSGLSGAPTGGLAMHPDHPTVPLAFISGVDPGGFPFVDVVDTRYFSVQRRIFVRDRVVGTLIAVPAAPGTAVALRLYAITAQGVVAIDLTADDLRPVP